MLEVPLGGVWEKRDRDGFRPLVQSWPTAYLQLHADCILRWPTQLPESFEYE
jgi:hypothetical protein